MQNLVEIGWCLVVGPAKPGQGLHDRVHSFHLDYILLAAAADFT